jgi:hypothetical protein
VDAVAIFLRFDRSSGAALFQFQEKASWIPVLKANYYLGVDGISLPMVVLTAFLGVMVVLISWKIHERVREYFVWLLLLETSILGVFASLDLLLFFVFWEIEIIPMYFLISVWGSGRKEYSSIKYVLFTLFGSALMLAGILGVYFSTGTLNMVVLAGHGLAMIQSIMPATVIFFLLLAGFAVKLPMFPLHRGQRYAGWSIDKDGWLRHHPGGQLLSGAFKTIRPAPPDAGRHRHHLRGGPYPEADRPEEDDRLQQRQPHGLRAPWCLRSWQYQPDRGCPSNGKPRFVDRLTLCHGRPYHP